MAIPIRSGNRGWISLKALVCAVALWVLSFQTAEASIVEVVRPSPSGGGWITVLGDLETPETAFDPFNNKKGIIDMAPFVTPVAPVGYRIGRWESDNFGPIFADVSFFKSHEMDLASSSNPFGGIPFSDQAATDNTAASDVLGDSTSSAGSLSLFSSFDGTLFGNIPGSLSGEITGTTGGSVDIVLSGQVDTVSSVPLPGAEGLFITGLVGWLGFIHHRSLVRKLGPLSIVLMTGWAHSRKRWMG